MEDSHRPGGGDFGRGGVPVGTSASGRAEGFQWIQHQLAGGPSSTRGRRAARPGARRERRPLVPVPTAPPTGPDLRPPTWARGRRRPKRRFRGRFCSFTWARGRRRPKRRAGGICTSRCSCGEEDLLRFRASRRSWKVGSQHTALRNGGNHDTALEKNPTRRSRCATEVIPSRPMTVIQEDSHRPGGDDSSISPPGRRGTSAPSAGDFAGGGQSSAGRRGLRPRRVG